MPRTQGGISKAELTQALSELEQRLIRNADDAHAAIGKRLDRIEERMDQLEERMDQRFDHLEAKLLAPPERTQK